MISKQNLLREVDRLLELKKRATPLLNQHILSAVSFSGLKEDEQNMIAEKFKNMAAQQTRHIDLLRQIKDSATKGKSNAY